MGFYMKNRNKKDDYIVIREFNNKQTIEDALAKIISIKFKQSTLIYK